MACFFEVVEDGRRSVVRTPVSRSGWSKARAELEVDDYGQPERKLYLSCNGRGIELASCINPHECFPARSQRGDDVLAGVRGPKRRRAKRRTWRRR